MQVDADFFKSNEIFFLMAPADAFKKAYSKLPDCVRYFLPLDSEMFGKERFGIIFKAEQFDNSIDLVDGYTGKVCDLQGNYLFTMKESFFKEVEEDYDTDLLEDLEDICCIRNILHFLTQELEKENVEYIIKGGSY